MSASDSLSEASQPLEQEGEEGWDDWESDEGTGFQSLFGDARFQSLEEVLQHDQEQHGFGLRDFRVQVGSRGMVLWHDVMTRGAVARCRAGLCCAGSFPTLSRHCLPSTTIPLQHGLDQLGTIRLVNFIRVQTAAGLDPRPSLAAAAPGSGAAPWLDDRYLQACRGETALLDWAGRSVLHALLHGLGALLLPTKLCASNPPPAPSADGTCSPTPPLQPALMDDELLFHDWEADDEEMAEAAAAGTASAAAAGAADTGSTAAAANPAEVAALRAENEALRGMLEAMRAVVLADEGMRELAAEAAQQRGDAGGSGSAGVASTSAAGGGAAAPQDEEAKRIDESYFDSYSTFDIHREMLADKVSGESSRGSMRWACKNGGVPAAVQIRPTAVHGRSQCFAARLVVSFLSARCVPSFVARWLPWVLSLCMLSVLPHPPRLLRRPCTTCRCAPRRIATRWRRTPRSCAAPSCWMWAAARASCRCARHAAAQPLWWALMAASR